MISYKKLWHVLLDKTPNGKDLVALAGINTYHIVKLNRSNNITTDMLQRMRRALKRHPSNIMARYWMNIHKQRGVMNG